MSGHPYTPDWQSVCAVFGVILMVGSMMGATAASTATGDDTEAALSPASDVSPVDNETTDAEPEGSSGTQSQPENRTVGGEGPQPGPTADSENATKPSSYSHFKAGPARSRGSLRVLRDPVMYVNETAAVGYVFRNECDPNALYCDKHSYDWSVTPLDDSANGDNDQLLHQSTSEIDSEIGHAARANTFRPTEPGEYLIVVDYDRRTRSRFDDGIVGHTHFKTIEVREDSDYYDGMSRNEILREHSPIVNFHPEEDFYPTRYEAYVENSKLSRAYQGPGGVAATNTIIGGASMFDVSWYKGRQYPVVLDPETEGLGSHESYQRNVVEEEYPNTIYGTTEKDVTYKGNDYVALGYWMVYINDPKPKDERGGPVEIASHTGDQEGAVVLVNESGPQWVATQQHFGGELRAWENVERSGDRPELYVGEGSHPTFFGPDHGSQLQSEAEWDGDEIGYNYQEQYLCDGSGGPQPLGLVGCGINDSGEPDRPSETVDYEDPVEDGVTWTPDDYEVTLLTGNEEWSNYEGDVYRYSSTAFKSSFIPSRGIMGDDGLEDFIDINENPRQQREAFPTVQQINGYLTSSASSDYDVDYDIAGTPTSVEVDVNNNGYQPHSFVVGQRDQPETRRQVFVESEDIETGYLRRNVQARYPGETEADIPVDLDGEGPWQVTLELTAYGGDNVLDTKSITLQSESNAEAEIIENDGSAGSIDRPQTVSQTIRIERGGNAYLGEFPDFNISVGGQSVDLDRRYRSGPGEYQIWYTPPTQTESGRYDLEIDIGDGPTVTRSDAITYSNTSGTQVAANLQIDRSSSMDEVIDEAKEGGATFVEQSDDDDSVSVVSYADNARTDQSLTELSTGRSDVVDEIEDINAGGLTNIGASLERGLDSLDSAPDGTTRAAILMTDGILIRGPSEQEILEDIVPEYNEQGVCLYTIGFGSGADEDLLQDIADASDCGEYRFAGEEGEVDSISQTLQSVYQDLGGEVSDAETIASESGTVSAGNNTTGQFVIDDSVGQTTANLQIAGLVDPISPAPASDEPRANIQLAPDTGQSDEIRLVRPDGTVLNTSDANVSKSVVGDTVIYRIDDPQAGEWSYELRNTQSDDAQYSVDVTGEARTELDVQSGAETYSPGSRVNLTATLFGPDGGFGNATIDGTVTLPDGNKTAVSFAERQPGLYAGNITPEQTGAHTVEVTATDQNSSLERQATTTFTVDDAPSLSISQSDSPEITAGDTGTATLKIEPESEANYTLKLSQLTEINGTATISSSDVWLEQRLVSEPADVNVTADIDRSVPAGTYEGTVKAYSGGGTVITEQLTVSVLEPATFKTDITDSPSSVEEGESLTFTATVTNTGDVAGTQNVSLLVGGVGSESTEVSLDNGSSTTVTLSVPTTAGDSGTRSATVGSRDDRNSTNVDVLGPAFVRVGMPNYETLPEGDEEIVIDGVAKNVGDETATQQIELADENGTVATRAVTLGPGEFRRFNFTYATDTATAGQNLTLSSGNTSTDVVLVDRLASYANSEGVIDSVGLERAVIDWKYGIISKELLDEVTRHWATGATVS